MTAPRITAEEIEYLRGFVAIPRAMSRETIRTLDDVLDAIESAYAELDRLSAQGEEVPGPDEFDVDEVLCEVADVGDYEREIAYGVWERIRAKVAANSRPAPPHPDTVEVSREEWTIAQLLANAWTRHPLTCSERDKLVSEWDALRSQRAAEGGAE